jgi:hypothetical protein
VNRALRSTLLGLAVVVVATGCSGEQKQLTLQQWASSVCATFDTYLTDEVKSGHDELTKLRLAAYGIDDPKDVDFKNPPKLREDAPQLISLVVVFATS